MEKSQLYYKTEAAEWMEALPIGNGSMGAMIYGGIHEDTVSLNEESFWAGYPRDTNNTEAKQYLEEVRSLILEGKNQKAQEIIEKNMLGRFNQPFQPIGTLHIKLGHSGEACKYKRKLNMNHGLISTEYEIGGVTYRREYFCSYPDQILVITFTADRKEALNLSMFIDNVCPYESIVLEQDMAGIETEAPSEIIIGDVYRFYQDNQILYGQSKKSLHGVALMKAVSEDGSVIRSSGRLEVKNSSCVKLFLAAATTFKGKDAMAVCRKRIEEAQKTGTIELRDRHTKDVSHIFNKMSLSLNNDKKNNIQDIIELLQNQDQEENRDMLVDLLFQYGRYLLIASSRKGSLPPTLQGIWNNKMVPPWWSNWTMNINLQMNYWPVCRCNLLECIYPYHEFIKGVSKQGRKTAEIHYGCRGWTSHHMMDIWMNTNPVGFSYQREKDSASWAQWNMSGPWMCLDMWEYYCHTKDDIFLKKTAFPIMKECALFLLDWLRYEDGTYRTIPSTSPENIFWTDQNERCAVCESSAMDMEIIREFLQVMICVCKKLKVKAEEISILQNRMEKLRPVQIGKYGQILEWNGEYEEEDSGHRHFSMLFSLYPGHDFTEKKNPELYRASGISLKRRMENGGGGTGWSLAWAICLSARLKQGQEAYQSIVRFLREDIFSNLFGYHPPDYFQIDCNFGFTAAISEMLLQIEEELLIPLPAIPNEWHSGYVRGLLIYGGDTVDLRWQNNKLSEITIHAISAGKSRIRMQDENDFPIMKPDIVYQKCGKELSFYKEKNQEYHIFF